jgi:hypothetical protein
MAVAQLNVIQVGLHVSDFEAVELILNIAPSILEMLFTTQPTASGSQSEPFEAQVHTTAHPALPEYLLCPQDLGRIFPLLVYLFLYTQQERMSTYISKA